ncbi:MAG: DUF2917 domain-containing protein [Verrucomicrobiaceae bacterium]|nr:MAG: DUF2917 domain-containing protein [Verrucomicrobiaceae bacterium]
MFAEQEHFPLKETRTVYRASDCTACTVPPVCLCCSQSGITIGSMKTNSLCNAPAPLAFVAAEGNTVSPIHQAMLEKDAIWRSADRASGVEIQVLDGLIWITVEGDPHDYILHKGENFRSGGNTRVVAQSLGAQARMLVN